MRKFNYAVAVPMIFGTIMLSACAGNPAQTTTTTTETSQQAVPYQQQAVPAPVQTATPGTVTTETTHSETVPVQ